MCKSIVDPGRPQMTIWSMRIVCWILKTTNTFRTCNTAFPLQRWLQKRASILRYVYIVCLVVISFPYVIPKIARKNSSIPFQGLSVSLSPLTWAFPSSQCLLLWSECLQRYNREHFGFSSQEVWVGTKEGGVL